MSKGKAAKYLGRGLTSCAIAGAMVAMSCGVGFAATASKIDSSSTPVNVDSNLLTTMGARAGSAGPDFLGISNMNYDFQPSHSANAGDPYEYYLPEGTNDKQSGTGYKADMAKADHFNRLAIWGTAINENANPYYQNLLVNVLLGTDTDGGLPTGYTKATTYHNNGASWGDVAVGGESVISKDYAPDIIFGANKKTNWNEDYSAGTKAKAAADAIEGYNPTYANNDSTNIWTQIYTMQQLAAAADKVTSSSNKVTRYDNSNASATALAYEKAIKGQMLYVASQIDAKKVAKKKVAYLYAIDSEAGKAYFFVPQAKGLVSGNDTGAGATKNTDPESANQDVYAANNSIINMGYMATLPFITDTFGAAKGEGTVREGGIQTLVEDIYKKNPVVEVSAANGAKALKDVDLIIYNSTTSTTMQGNNNGLCKDTDIKNTAPLNDDSVATWAKAYGFSDKVLAGDDYGTSNKQQTAIESAPMMYCQRNYTVDKNVRAAWAYSKVYPELFNNNDDASYAYWLQEIYHIKADKVNQVLAAYTHQNAANVKTYANNTAQIEKKVQTGYNWYKQTAGTKYTKTYAYYNGSSRASYYGGKTAEEPKNTIGIFEPSNLWTAQSKAVLKAAKAKVTVKQGKKVSVKISGAKKAVKASVAKKSGLKLAATKTKLTVTAPKTAKKGTYTVKVTSAGAVATSVKVTVK